MLRPNRRIWSTWSGTAGCLPAQLAAPTSEDEIAEAVRAAVRNGLNVRTAGTGHSFNRLVTTPGALLDLTSYKGVVAVDRVAGEVTVRAGTRIGELCRVLDRDGLALANIGTLADQTIAGALSTGNHGTGLAHPPLSGQVARLRLLTADGNVLTVGPDDDPDLWGGVRTALGTLGVLTTVTLRCVPQFNLRHRVDSAPLQELLERFGAWAGESEHPSLNWQPWTDRVTLRSIDRTDAPSTPRASARRLAATLDEVRCGFTGQVARVGGARTVPALTAGLGGLGPTSPYVDASHRVFTFPQPVRFLAMEHALPLERTADALRELRPALRRLGMHSPYSVLVRVGAGDDVLLSPAHGRATGYVNLTVPRTVGHLEILRIAEHILRGHDARPHWGKAHTATAEVLAPRYPRWKDFRRIRAVLDPEGTFSNEYTDKVLGPVDAADRR
ncbi:D-arabinono-1,4-lactone oxidase [Streptomyces sp. NBC_00829]|uniref:D-arabinono-1,4-lactone oxidase n=1 Tax=Streptomyces sp. NBC_00829 TaxID=2903679 RepID=UPI003869A01E|nr:FAD-binding protein [Streptomyces sp. NBC_00829]